MTRRRRGPVVSFLVGASMWAAAVVACYLLVLAVALGVAGLLFAIT